MLEPELRERVEHVLDWLADDGRIIHLDHRRREHEEMRRISRLESWRQGMTGEAFVHQITGLEWRSPDRVPVELSHLPDVGYLDVRACARGGLIIRRADLNFRPFVLARVEGWEVEVPGWCFPFDARSDRYLQTRWTPPAWLVPGYDLSPALPLYRDWFE